MEISVSCARSIKTFRAKNYVLGFCCLMELFLQCYEFVKLRSSFYQLIFLAELIIVSFLTLVVFINQHLAMKQTSYVLIMSHQINEIERVDIQSTEQEIEEMIKNQSKRKASTWSVYYSSIKMCFHNYCCESKDFLYLFLSFGIFLSYNYKPFQSDETYSGLLRLVLINFWDFHLVIVGFIIEMPRRIRQFYKMRALQRRADQQFFLNLQSQQTFENNFSEGQQGLREDLLEYQQMNEQRIEVRQVQNGMQAQDEQICCTICSEDMNVNSNIQKLQCHPSHIFHSQCINDWFQRNRQENKVPSCPICRAPQNG